MYPDLVIMIHIWGEIKDAESVKSLMKSQEQKKMLDLGRMRLLVTSLRCVEAKPLEEAWVVVKDLSLEVVTTLQALETTR